MDRTETEYSRLALGLLLLAAASPWRVYGSFPLVASLSVLDAAVLLAAAVMVARRAMVHDDHDTGDRWATLLVAVLPMLAVTSFLWTADAAATVRETVSYGEGFVAYLFAIQQTRGLPAARIVRMLRRFLYALLVPPVLMLVHVPGFEPQEPGIKTSSGPYLSFFSRLSHPFIGRSNNLATVLLLLCVVLVYWALTHGGLATYGAAFLSTAGIVLTVSRGAILALLSAAVLALLLPRPPRPGRRRSPVAFVVVSALLLLAVGWAFYLFNPTTREFLGNRVTLSNVTLRELRFSDGVALLLQRPFLGYGAGALPGNDVGIAGGVHNTYLQQLLAYGVVLGFIGVLSLVGLAVHFLWRQQSGARRAVGLTVVALLVDLTVESSFEGAALRVIIYLLLGMLLGLARADDAPQVTGPHPARRHSRDTLPAAQP